MLSFSCMALRYFLFEFFQSIVLVPVWWYSTGLQQMLGFVGRSVSDYQAQIAVGIWVKNIFVPMYGSRDLVGRAISFLVRLVQIFIRSLFLLVYAMVLVVVLVAYLALPLVIVIELLIQGVGLFSV